MHLRFDLWGAHLRHKVTCNSQLATGKPGLSDEKIMGLVS